MIYLIFGNMWLWFNILLVAIAAVLIYYKTSEYNLYEFSAQIGISVLVIFVSGYIMFSFHSDIQQKEIVSAFASEVVYEEPWTEEYDCSSTDSKGRRTHRTCTTRHSSEFYIGSPIGNLPINQNEYGNWTSEFGKKEISKYRFNQTTSSRILGEGDIWKTVVSKPVPVSAYHSYDNYVTASSFTIQRTQKQKPDAPILPYPSISSGTHGTVYFNRVLNDVNLSSVSHTQLNNALSLVSAEVGKSKQINPLIYITKRSPIKVVNDLEIAWKKGNKNDSILVLQIDGNNTIIGSDSLNWSANKSFATELRYAFNNTQITDYNKIVGAYKEIIQKNWSRRTMESYKYLLEDVSLPLSDQIIIILINTILNIGLFILFSRNQHRRMTAF